MKVPTPCEALATLRPVQLIGGEQTLFAVTADGKVRVRFPWSAWIPRDAEPRGGGGPGCGLLWPRVQAVALGCWRQVPRASLRDHLGLNLQLLLYRGFLSVSQ